MLNQGTNSIGELHYKEREVTIHNEQLNTNNKLHSTVLQDPILSLEASSMLFSKEITTGLTTEEATNAIIKEIQSVRDRYKRQTQKRLSWFGRLTVALDFLRSLEGAAILVCLFCLIVGEVIIVIARGFNGGWSSLLCSVFLILPYLWANLTISWKLRKAEQIRPFAQIDEALRVLKTPSSKVKLQQNKSHRLDPTIMVHPHHHHHHHHHHHNHREASSANSHNINESSLWNPPSSTLVSVFRDQVWRRVPSSMIARGDIYKLLSGELFPTDAVRVELGVGIDPENQHTLDESNAATSSRATVRLSDLKDEDTDRTKVVNNGKVQTKDEKDSTCKRTDGMSFSNKRELLPENQEGVFQTTVYIRLVANSARYHVGDRFLPICQQHNKSTNLRAPSPADPPGADKNKPNAKSPRTIQRIPLPSRIRRPSTRQSATDQGCSTKSFSESSTASSIHQYEELYYSSSIQRCSALAYATFEATSYASVPSVERFLERMVPKKSQDPWETSKRRKTTFFETTRLVRQLLINCLIIGLLLCLLSNFAWATYSIVNINDIYFGSTDLVIVNITNSFLHSVYLTLSFMPLVYRILIEVTDVWGNARLQSLFQWLQDTRLPSTEQPSVDQQNGIATGGASSFSSTTSSDSGSVASSVDSSMSVSRLPLRNQFSELLAVLTQGLDGASNLLHTLNSTTSVVVVDKEGILTDTQRSIQEICVAETVDRLSRRRLSGRTSKIHSHHSASLSSTQQACLEQTNQQFISSSSDLEVMNFNQGAVGVQYGEESDDKVKTESPRFFEKHACYQQTEISNTPWNTQNQSSCFDTSVKHHYSGRVVFDLLSRPTAPDGQRFEDIMAIRRHINALRPLTTLMAAAKLPLGDAQYQDFSRFQWLFSLSVRDILQSDILFSDGFRDCICSLKSLCGVTEKWVDQLTILRFILAVQRRVVKGVRSSGARLLDPKASATKKTEEVRTISCSEGSVQMAAWLLRSAKDGAVQMVTKGQPRSILRRAAYYFDGQSIRPMTKSLRRSLVELITQWKSDGLETVAFGYRPLDKEQQAQSLYSLDEYSVFAIDPEQIVIPASSQFTTMDEKSQQYHPTLLLTGTPQERQSNSQTHPTPILEELWDTHPFLNDFTAHDESHLLVKQEEPFSSSHSVTESKVCLKDGLNRPSLLHHPSTQVSQVWTSISIFPGPRSSIGGAPVVQVCSISPTRIPETDGAGTSRVEVNSNRFLPYLPHVSSEVALHDAQSDLNPCAALLSHNSYIEIPSQFINYSNMIRQIVPLKDWAANVLPGSKQRRPSWTLFVSKNRILSDLRFQTPSYSSFSPSSHDTILTHSFLSPQKEVQLISTKSSSSKDGTLECPQSTDSSQQLAVFEHYNESQRINSSVTSLTPQLSIGASNGPSSLFSAQEYLAPPNCTAVSSLCSGRSPYFSSPQPLYSGNLSSRRLFQLPTRFDPNTFISLPPPQTSSLNCPLLSFQKRHAHVTSDGKSHYCSHPYSSSTPKISSVMHAGDDFRRSSSSKAMNEFIKPDHRTVDAGELVRRLINKQIFLGMAALKLSTPQELATRVASFHEAGIRFVYMSRENTVKTKAVGNLLGLETDWNCLISLAPTHHGITNVVGNVVIPSGIEDIRRHIKEVDNVPLQVSLFSDGTPQSMLEMIQILQENGEIVTCIGSARRPSNFDLFDQANCSISVSVDMSPVCKQCLGRRCIGHINRHLFPPLSVDHNFSASLTSLPCSLQIHMESSPPQVALYDPTLMMPVSSPSDPRWLGELLYEAFKESRRIVDAIQQSVAFFAGVSTGFIAPMILLVCILNLPAFFRDVSLMATLLVFLPLISTTFLYSPAAENIMKEYPLRLSDHEQSKKELRRTCLSYALRFCPSSLICIWLTCYYFGNVIPVHTNRLIEKTSDPLLIKTLKVSCLEKNHSLMVFGGQWIQCLSAFSEAKSEWIDSVPLPTRHSQIVLQTIILLCLLPMSLSFIDRVQSLLRVPPTRNVWLLTAWTIIFILYSAGVAIEFAVKGSWKAFVAPNLTFWIILIVWMGIIVVIDELVKRGIKKKYELQQKYLKLLFATRLGMWSPK